MSQHDSSTLRPSEDRLNVTWYGECPECGISMTMTGMQADDIPETRARLGTAADQDIRCVACHTVVPVRCVGIALHPFVAKLDDSDEEERDSDDD